MIFRIYLILIIFFNFFNCKDGIRVYETNVVITRMDTITFDKDNNHTAVDLEISYIECPGDQIEVIRGDRNFAQCLYSLGKKVGDKLHVDIEWKWGHLGYYKWVVKRVDTCERVIDLNDQASFDLIEECEDIIVYGNKVGFTCKKIPTDKLIKVCPWFKKN